MNYVPANPGVTPQHIVPEWYFLPFYAILRGVPDKLGGVILMFGAIVMLALLPWLDTSKVRSACYRPLYRQFIWIFAAVVIGLGYLGAMPPEGGYVIAVAHPDGALLRPLPDRPADSRPGRENQAAAGFDRRFGPRQGGRQARRPGRARQPPRRPRAEARRMMTMSMLQASMSAFRCCRSLGP